MDRTNIIGEKIKDLRTAKEISIDELAERTGLTAGQIERIENNIDIPSLAPLLKIARALGVRLGTFLDDQSEEDGPWCAAAEKRTTPSAFRTMPSTHASTCTTIRSRAARRTATWNRSSSTSMRTTMPLPCRHTKGRSSSWC